MTDPTTVIAQGEVTTEKRLTEEEISLTVKVELHLNRDWWTL